MSGQRWPVHPPPAKGEALSSWLTRIASIYCLTLDELLRHNLGPASFELDTTNNWVLDSQPAATVLTALHERTGIPAEQLTQATITGLIALPGNPPDQTDANPYTGYAQQFSILLDPGEAVPRNPTDWHPWCPRSRSTGVAPPAPPQPATKMPIRTAPTTTPPGWSPWPPNSRSP